MQSLYPPNYFKIPTHDFFQDKLTYLPLPINPKLFTKIGDHVKIGDLIAEGEEPEWVQTLAVFDKKLLRKESWHTKIKKLDEQIKKGEHIIYDTLPWNWKNNLRSPLQGTISAISPFTGTISIRKTAAPVYLYSHINGIITNIINNKTIEIKASYSAINDIIAHGKSVWGTLQKYTPDIFSKPNKNRSKVILYTNEVLQNDMIIKIEKYGFAGIIGNAPSFSTFHNLIKKRNKKSR
ncbi:hypothetical protein OAB57_01645, partial [Bacteriovoracaceae bacterium]|nr:hypothetical protein [Bacteriovoracaceae bacterium]